MRNLFLWTTIALFGCAEDQNNANGDDGPATWHQDIRPIVERSCQGCHEEGGVAPFTLDNYEDVMTWLPLVIDSIENNTMPPWLATDGCNDYLEDISLTPEEKTLVLDWANGDALEGDESDAVLGDVLVDEGLPRVDLTLEMPVAYTPTEGPDEYRCFILDWPEDTEPFVTGFNVVPGNQQTVHHVIVYMAPPHLREEFEALDEADPGEGYRCFGGPGVINQEDAAWLGGWAPGSVARPFPEGLGLAVDKGTVMIMQMHYYTENNQDPDQSKIEIMTAETVEKQAWIQPFANPLWLFGGSMVIPAGETDFEHSFEVSFPANLDIYNANLHMHTRGKTANFKIDHPDGSETCLVNIDKWDFDWQRSYAFTEVEQVRQGDTLSLTCTWDNMTNQDLDWGDGTVDEMCLSTMLVSLSDE